MAITKERTKGSSKNGTKVDLLQEEVSNLKVSLANFVMYRMTVRITGETPLLVARLAPEMLGYDGKTGEPLEPQEELEKGKRKKVFDFHEAMMQSRYLMPDGRDAFPGGGLVKALGEAGRRFSRIPKVQTYGQIRIPVEYVPLILTGPPQMKVSTGKNRNAGGAAIVIARALYQPWSLDVPVIYWANTIEMENVVNLFRIAGMAIGIGAWRPEKGGIFGQFDVEAVLNHKPYNRYENRREEE